MHRVRLCLPALAAATVTIFGLGLSATTPAVSPLAGTPQKGAVWLWNLWANR
ncbi:hypothetical protein [Streptomyces lasiicapitis]|uniref:hypothetical protein n=1 Tax=Streptomyces lasiicapitis TaxID=1923961 RepID=UPI0036566916